MKSISSCPAQAFVIATLGLMLCLGFGQPAAAVGEERKSPNPLSGNAEAIAAGKTLFRAGCGYCHGMRANGRGRGAPAGSVAADLTKFKRGYTAYLDAVRNGYKLMPAWGGLKKLTQEELDQIGAWLETMAKAGANWNDPK